MKDFVCIDFETANGKPSSVCSVGLVLVRDGQVVDNFYSLIHPRPNYFASFCQRVHGLGHDDVRDAPCFPAVWLKIEACVRRAFLGGQGGGTSRHRTLSTIPFVAHNARFDEGCLKAVFAAYALPYPEYRFLDTLAASRRHFGRTLPNHQLHTVAAACGYDLTRHHHALADAQACAVIALRLLP
ncbi:MAG: 3'-5' exonuclease [Desulfovibrio sp.]|nr:3'-5' exonuclease [Desulfovibrio sp.]